jgi:hypothetical protein
MNNPFENGPYDILADYKGNLIRIQVKGTAAVYNKVRSPQGKSPWTVNAYTFHVAAPQLQYAELIAFVATDIEKIIYRTPDELTNNLTGIQFKPETMQQGCDKSLLQLLEYLNAA